ncbi:MAG: extracellular solute-binding protein, partial [Chloroflexi bacterium]|nr:extracellular solute-binding protein [Chloroflexota bacterium]
LARTVAQDIADNDSILVVLGHMFSSTSVIGGEVYKEAGIPAVSGSATADAVTAENDYYFRTIPNNHAQSAFLANYAQRIMDEPVASIIYDEDVFGTGLAQSYANTFQGLGGELRYAWHFDNQSPTLADDLEAVVNEMVRAENGDPGLVFLAMHTPEAKSIIVNMRRKGFNNPLMGPTSLGNPRFVDEFVDLPEEQTQRGFFLDDLYAATPILFDVAGENAQAFRETYMGRYGVEPSLKAPGFYDAAMVALTAVQHANIAGQPQNIAADREKIRLALANINSPEVGVKGVTGNIFFNKTGDMIKPLFVGVFAQQRLISALTQLQPVTDLHRIVDLQEELDAGRILIVDGHYVYRTNVVYTGIDLNEVSHIDTKTSSYSMDFYLWFRYQGEFDETSIEFVNSDDEINLGEPIAKEFTEDYTYRAYRIKADLNADFDFSDYPFDTQTLHLQLRHQTLMQENLIFVVDVLGLRYDSQEAILSKLARSDAFDEVSGWQVLDALYYVDQLHNESTLGNPHFLQSNSNIEFSRFNTELQIQRNTLSFFAKNMLPLLIILMLAYVVFYIPIKTLSPRIVISVNALLTVAFFHLRLGNDLPGIGYLIALDYAFYGIYVLIATKLLITVLANMAYEKEDIARVDKLNQFGKIAYPSMILLGIILFSWRYELIPVSEWFNGRLDQVETAVAAATDTQPSSEAAPMDETIVLTLQSWRVEDSTQMNKILDAFHAKYPHIQVQFSPMVSTKYNDVLQSQLEHGVASDLFYLRSFTQSELLYEAGYLEPLQDVNGLSQNFTEGARRPWMSREDVPYGVPFIAVSHAIYVNQDIFEELKLDTPQTWEELQMAAAIIENAGIIPFANASGDPWTIAELVFMNLAPN